MVEDNGAKLFPAFQFDGDTIRPAMSRILAAAPGASGWAVLQYLVSGDEGLGDTRPIDLIKGNEADIDRVIRRSEEHTSELQSLMRISYAVFCLNTNKTQYKEDYNK